MEGLAEQHCQVLAGVQVGDYIVIERSPRARTNDDDGESEADTHSDSDDDESESEAAVGSVEETESATARNGDEDLSNENEGDDEEAGDLEGGSEDNENSKTSATLFYVHNIVKDDTGAITDISLCLLEYSSQPSEVNSPSYHVYGANIVRNVSDQNKSDGIDGSWIKSIKVVVSDESFSYDMSLNPTGDHIRDIVFYGQCPAECNNGWLDLQEDLQATVTDTIQPVAASYSPVCPVCMGKDVMQEYHSLRQELEVSSFVDMGSIIEFLGRLNPRRRQLGYSFKQFDEREWGYLFDDIPSEDEEEEDGNHHDGWEYFEEALDPSSNVVLHPASDAAIAGLPRIAFTELRTSEVGTECLVCQEKFAEDTIVVELPCGHIFCDGGCAEQWLKQFNSCPTCRTKLPAKDEEDREATADGITAVSNNGDLSDGDSKLFRDVETETELRGGDDVEDSVTSEPVAA